MRITFILDNYKRKSPSYNNHELVINKLTLSLWCNRILGYGTRSHANRRTREEVVLSSHFHLSLGTSVIFGLLIWNVLYFNTFASTLKTNKRQTLGASCLRFAMFQRTHPQGTSHHVIYIIQYSNIVCRKSSFINFSIINQSFFFYNFGTKLYSEFSIQISYGLIIYNLWKSLHNLKFVFGHLLQFCRLKRVLI